MDIILTILSSLLFSGILIFFISQYVRINFISNYLSISLLLIVTIVLLFPEIKAIRIFPLSQFPVFILIFAILSLLVFAYFYHKRGFGIGKNIIRQLNSRENVGIDSSQTQDNDRNQKSIKKYLLTYDDGPSIKWTPEIIDILHKRDIRAMFFVVGKEAEKYPEVIRSMNEAEMEICVHSYSHKPLPFLFTESIRQEIKRTTDIIKRITGKSPRYFRPPWGLYNKEVVDIAAENGLTMILWSLSSRDWKERNSGKIRNNVVENISGSEILLFHDGCKRGTSRKSTVESLPVIIDELKEMGYIPATPGLPGNSGKET